MTASTLDRASFGGALLLWLWLLAGCASTPPGQEPDTAASRPIPPELLADCQRTLATAFPPGYEAVHRAVITHRGHEYVCDGFLQVTPESGHHLALISTLGQVSEVRWHPATGSQVVKVTPLMPAEWSRDYVLRDLRLLFVPPPDQPTRSLFQEHHPVLLVADSEGVSRRYVFSGDGRHWEELRLERDGRLIYRARVVRRRPVGEYSPPMEWRVEANEYELWIRVVDFHPHPTSAGSSANPLSRPA